jgi:peptide/nickel transport system ATP-binding protein
MTTAEGPRLRAGAIAEIEGLNLALRRDGRHHEVLRGVDLSIQPGEILGLVGESGSGKSVLALSLMGLLPSESDPRFSGAARIAGVDMLHAAPPEQRTVRRGELGVIFQDPMTSLNPTMRVGRQITETGQNEAEGIRLLTEVGVSDPELRMRVFPHQLSGGLRQRVMAAIAVSGNPSLVIADEPTTALDVTVQAQLLTLLRDLRDEFGCGILFITHDLAVAAQITDRIAVMYAGRVAESGPSADLLAHPSHPYTAGLLAARLSLTTPRDERLRTLPVELGDHDARMAGCAYHTRCPLALERCATDVPPLEPLAPSAPSAPPHLRACWAPAESVFAHVGETAPPDPVTAAPAEVAVAGEVPDAGTPVVVADAVRCDFKVRGAGGRKVTVHALRGVDLSVMAGEAVSIVGESGSGKSTLLRVLAGLTKASGGTARVAGAVQMVFQDAGSSLTPWMTVGETLRERLRPLRLGRAEAGTRVEETLEAIGLPRALTSAKPVQLSGGQRQRVALARATIIAPAVLLCDEPTSSLDASLAASVLNLIRQMRSELGMAVIFVTHDISVARLMGDRVGVMREGELVEIGATEDVLSRPQHPYTRTLLSAVPEIDLATGEAA